MKVVPISAVVRTPEIVPNSLLAQLPGTELRKKNKKYRQLCCSQNFLLIRELLNLLRKGLGRSKPATLPH